MTIVSASIAYIALGSNLGDRHDYLKTALSLLEKVFENQILAVSQIYQSTAVDLWEDAPPDFLNAACKLQTTLPAPILLRLLQQIERSLGREHTPAQKHHSRSIDLDLIFYDDLQYHSVELTIPHPCWYLRDFVLYPLREILPDLWQDPVKGLPIDFYLKQLSCSSIKNTKVNSFA